MLNCVKALKQTRYQIIGFEGKRAFNSQLEITLVILNIHTVYYGTSRDVLTFGAVVGPQRWHISHRAYFAQATYSSSVYVYLVLR